MTRGEGDTKVMLEVGKACFGERVNERVTVQGTRLVNYW